MTNLFKLSGSPILFVLIFLLLGSSSSSQDLKERVQNAFVFWHGFRSEMTIHELVSYCAPVFWYSADEPMLYNKTGKDIRIPQRFPFDSTASNPVVYYMVKNIFTLEDKEHAGFRQNKTNFDSSIVNLNYVNGMDICYNHYYEFESGLGRHHHDTEQSEFKVYVLYKQLNDTLREYSLVLLQVTAKAHALEWYDNVFNIDLDALETNLPFNILVEEGKHASCTDANGDGHYTPGYDVNIRKNDAWGLRDVIRSGELFTSQYQAYMSKIRKPEYRVLPPLPNDSPHRHKYITDSVYARDNSVYELRPMPKPSMAGKDLHLKADMEGYYQKNWPEISDNMTNTEIEEWWESGQLIKSIGIMGRYNNTFGVSATFPLLIIKNVEAPLIGGWIVNRVYLQGKNMGDVGYNLLITPSASRFMDPYFAAGVEFTQRENRSSTESKYSTDFVLETGLKFRGNVRFTPLKFLSAITDFWGVRVGIKNKGFKSIREMTYVIEFGAGVW